MENLVDGVGGSVVNATRSQKCGLSTVLLRVLAIAVLVVAAQAIPMAVGVKEHASAAPKNWNGKPTQWKCDEVDYATPLDSDRLSDGRKVSPKPDVRDRWVPVIMVHGWTGRAIHTIEKNREGAFSKKIDLTPRSDEQVDAQRSMIGQIQTVPGAAVFTFDYHVDSGKWVTDNNIGPRLGEAIDSLFEASGGEKVIVVAHSMGGLATRYALQEDASRVKKVSTAVTMGTPNTGSLLAQMAAAARDATLARLSLPVETVLRALLSVCPALTSANMDALGGACSGLIGTFDNAGGQALRSGSPQLADLARWPGPVQVHALGADATVKVAVRYFGFRFAESDARMGDIIVGADSATAANADATKLIRCKYRLDVVQDPISSALSSVRIVTGEEDPFAILKPSACFHNNLPRAIDLTNEATGIIDDDITARAPTELVHIVSVDSSGNPLPDWTSQTTGRPSVNCDYTYPATSSVGVDIVSGCGTTADSAFACWIGSDRQSLTCPSDPWKQTYAQFRSSKRIAPVPKPAKEPEPEWLELDNGARCFKAHGGAWGGRSDGWGVRYGCGNESTIVLGQKDSPTIDRSKPRWIVHVGQIGDPSKTFPPPTQRVVTKAFFLASP